MTQNEMNDGQLDETMTREMLGRIQEHMQVRDNEGAHVGTVDKLEGDRIKLTRNDLTNPDDEHHYIPVSMIRSVDDVAVYIDGRLDEVRDQIFGK